ncbi:MAG: hypothetical protein ABIP89_19585, partial [Polyangiaceae bacterium]
LRTGRDDRVALDFEGLVNRAIRRKPSQRYSSALEMLDELRLIGNQIRAKSVPLVDDEVTRIAPNPTLALLAAEKLAAEEPEVETTVDPNPLRAAASESAPQRAAVISLPPPPPASAASLPPPPPEPAPRRGWSRVLLTATVAGVFGGGIVLGGILNERGWRASAAVAVAPPVIFVVDASTTNVGIISSLADAGDAGDASAIVDADVPEHAVPKAVVRVVRPPVDAGPPRPTRLSVDDADAPLP